MPQQEHIDKKWRLEEFDHKNIMLLMTALETIKKDICVKLQSEYRSPEGLVEKSVCSLVDANKIIKSRYDLMTLEFLLKVLANTGRKSFAAAYKVAIIQKYNIPIGEVLPHLRNVVVTDEFRGQVLTIDRLIEFLDIRMGIQVSSDFFLS